MLSVVGTNIRAWANSLEEAIELARITEYDTEISVDVSCYVERPLTSFVLEEHPLQLAERVCFVGKDSEWLFTPGKYPIEALKFAENYKGKVCVCATEHPTPPEVLMHNEAAEVLPPDTQWLICLGSHTPNSQLVPFERSLALGLYSYFIADFCLCPSL